MKENKRDRFLRVLEGRLSRIAKDCNLIRNLANVKNYHYTDEIVSEKFGVLEESIAITMRAFNDREKVHISLIEPTIDPIGDPKAEAFDRVINIRINRIIEVLVLIPNLSNRKHYSFTLTDVEDIELILLDMIGTAKFAFGGEISTSNYDMFKKIN